MLSMEEIGNEQPPGPTLTLPGGALPGGCVGGAEADQVGAAGRATAPNNKANLQVSSKA